MKKLLLSLVALIVVLALYPLFVDDPYLSHEEKHAKRILGTSAEIIGKKFNLQPCGAGLAMPGGNLKEFTLCFDAKKYLNKEELRILLIGCVREMLQQVNISEKIRPAMTVYPFTEKNICIIIYNFDPNKNEIYDPGIITARSSDGILEYKTIEAKNRYAVKNRFIETYQEALNTIQR